MTFFAYDGEYLLMDKVTQVKWHDPNDNFKKDHNGNVVVHFEKVTKIHGIDVAPKAKSWGNAVIFYTTIGKEDDTWKQLVTDTTMDLKVLTNLSPLYNCFDKETTYVWLEEDGTLCHTRYDHKACEFKTRECKITTYETTGGCTFFGYGSAELENWELLSNVTLTPLEAMVIQQARYPILGRRFDSLHVPTRKLTLDHDLSERQRNNLIERVMSRINLTRKCEEIWLSNVHNHKERV